MDRKLTPDSAPSRGGGAQKQTAHENKANHAAGRNPGTKRSMPSWRCSIEEAPYPRSSAENITPNQVAEYWSKLGEAEQTLLELESLLAAGSQPQIKRSANILPGPQD
ncbi:MAG: hypothetical protein WCQ21_31435 [Verrucomicrobiota bacterium]|jgi:hypothetical protein